MTALLTDNLPLLAGAPNGIKKLRELILELAVRGKLVPQEASDEPASELFKRIAGEKETPSPKVKKSSEPSVHVGAFELPNSWCWVGFGDIAQHNSGKTLDKGRNSGIPRDYITTSNLYWGKFELSSVRQMLIEEKDLARCTAIKNDLLICEGGEAGRAAVWDQDSEICFQNHVHRARFFGGVNPYYAQRYFERLNYSGEIAEYRKGVGISNMSSKALASIPVPLPPLAEQHRIVAKVDELMALCDRLESQQTDAESAHAQLVQALLESLTQASDATDFAANWQRLAEHFHTLFTTEPSIDALQQSLLQLAVMGKLVPQAPNDEPASELLGKIVSDRQKLADEGVLKKQRNLTEISEEEKLFAIPQGWVWARISSFSELKSGLAYKSEAFNETGGNQVIRMGNIRPNMLRLETNPVFISNDLARDTSDFSLIIGDIVLTMTGTKGKQDYMYSVLIEEEHLEKNLLYLNQRLCTVRTQVINPKFLILILQDKRLLDPIFRSSTGTANQANIGMSALNNWALPIPPLAEQNRIVDATDQVMSICETLKTKIKKSHQIHDLISSTLIVEGLA